MPRSKKNWPLLTAILGLLLLPVLAAAQTAEHSGDAHRMPAAKADAAESPAYSDRAYLSAMIVHHEAAVEMAKAVLKDGRNPLVKKWAEAVIGAQEAEIKQMRDWLEPLGGEDARAAAGMRHDMHSMMAAPAGQNPDVDFITMMIGHHAGAVEMALQAVLKSNDRRVIDLSRNIITAQIEEIVAYRDWLAQNAPAR